MTTALVWDHCLHPELAIRLGRDLDRVYYFSPWATAFPDANDQLIGTGLEEFNVERTDFPFELIGSSEEPDIHVFPDLYFTDTQMLLRRMGKHVWGSGWGELMELDRLKLNGVLKDAGLPTTKIEVVQGVMALKNELLKPWTGGEANKYIKVAQYYRGLTETFHHVGWPHSQQWLLDVAHRLGPSGEYMQFLIYDPIEGDVPEPGIDLIVVRGEPLFPTSFGYEIKDSGIISKVTLIVPDQFAPVYEVVSSLGNGYTNFFSGEVKVGGDGQHYMLDASCRMPRPADAIHMELWDNLPEIIVQGAMGKSVKPRPNGKYAAQIILNSDWVRDHPLHVEIPDSLRNQVKLWDFFRDEDGEYWVLPEKDRKDPNFGSVVAVGDSVEDVCKEAVEIAKAVKAQGGGFENDVLDRACEQIEKGIKAGVSW